MKIELTVIADIFIDDECQKISPDEVLKGIVIRDSDTVDGFELTTDIPGFDNTADFFLKNGRIKEKKFILDKCYFLAHRKCSDTWHVGYLEESEVGMISIAPTSFPVTYNDKEKAEKLLFNSVFRIRDSFTLNEIYEFEKIFDKKEAKEFVEKCLQKKVEENPNENNPC